MPFGSFTPDQPIAVLDTTVTMSNLADVGVALSVSATPGFAYGDSPTGTVPIFGSVVSASVTPQIARIQKTYEGPENETATGPNFAQSYVVSADLPNAIVFSSVRINDVLPGTHQFNAVGAVNPTATTSGSPSTVVPGGTLFRQWSTITGGTSASDASVSYSFHVPLLDAVGTPVIDAATGDDVATINDSSLVVTYTPVDTRDSATTTTVNPNTNSVDNHALVAKSIAIQKSSVISTNVGSTGFNAGDTLEYTIDGQVSDFFSDGGIIVTDIVGDGQTYVPLSASFTSTSEGVTTPAAPATSTPFTGADVVVDESQRTCGDGTTTVELHLSDALVTAGASGLVVGGLVHTTPNNGPATFQIKFRTVVSDLYACIAADQSVDEGDHVGNDVTVAADLYSPAAVALGTSETDDSATSRSIETAPVTKEMYAKNGVIAPFTHVAAGDLITYRIRTTSPSTDFEALTLTDFLPLPIFTVAAFATSPVATSCEAPGALTPSVDQACYGPADTMHSNGAAPDPAVSTDVVSNSITFDYGTYDDPGNNATEIDLLFTVRVTGAAFRDGLLFTNEVLKQYDNSFGDATTAANLAQLVLTEPVLDIAKGVASASNVNIGGLATPSTRNPTGVTWLNPGATAVSPGFTGTITTAGLAAGAPNANATRADAADVVRFAIVVENTGTGANGAFDVAIDDTFPAGFAVPSAPEGIRLLVTDGAGNELDYIPTGAFSATPGTAGPLSGTITLTDTATGSLAPGKTGAVVNTSGSNIAVITYELEVGPTAVPSTVHTNTTNLTAFSASESGPNFIALGSAASKTNLATVTAAPVGVAKAVIGSDQAFTDLSNLTIGEVVTYSAVLTVPEGTTDALNVLDTLDVGQAMVSIDSITASAALTSSVGFPTALTNARNALVAPGSTMTLDFGSVVNSDRVNTVAETITIVYTAIVLNVATNTITLGKNNTVTATYTGNPSGTTTVVAVKIFEPVLVTDKSATPTTADANDTVTFVVDVRHTGELSDTDAFVVTTVDVIPAGLIYVPDSLATSDVPATVPTTLVISGTTITATWDSLTRASVEFGQFTYQATVDPTTPAPAAMTNTATTTWASLSGPPTTTSTFNTNDTQRTGAGGVNDYLSADSATVSVSNPQIVKSLHATNDATTLGNNLTIGETGTYQLHVTLPESEIPTIRVADVIPTGMRYVAGTATIITDASVSDGALAANFGGTLGTAAFTPTTAGSTDTLTLDVGATTTVTADNDVTNNSFLVRFDAIVADVPGNVGHGTNTVLDNSATVRLDAGSVVTSNVVAVDVVEPRLDVVKTFSPNGATPGSNVTVTITVQNAGLSNGYESTLTDTIDARFDASTVVSTTVPAGWTFAAIGADLGWTADAGVAHATGTTLTFIFTVDLLASSVSGAAIPNTASASTTTRDGSPLAGERAEPLRTGSATLNVVTPDLNVTKSDGVTTAAPGTTLSYVVVTTNTGGAPATNVTLTDTIPAGTTYAGFTGPCVVDGGSTATVKVFDLGTIANGTNVTCTISITVDDPAPAGTSAYVNSVLVADDGTHGVDPTANNSAVDSDTIVAQPDLNVAKTDGKSSVAPGEAVTYTVTVTNTGNIGVTNVLITDTLPDGFTYESCTNGVGTFDAACSMSGGIVSTTVTVLAGGGATATLTVQGTVIGNPAPAGLDEIRNTVEAVDDQGNGADPTPTDNIAVDVDTVDAAPDLVISKTSLSSTVTPGSTIGYEIVVTNIGDQDATGLIVSDAFPAGLTAECGTEIPTATTCTATGYTWTAATFAVGTSTILTYTLLAADPMPAGTLTLTNTATVADDGLNGPDPTPENNSDSTDVGLSGTHFDLDIVKTDGVTEAIPGASLAYTITVTNTGNIGASGVTVVDTIPSGTTFESAPNTGHGVGVDAGGVVTWNVGAIAGGGSTVTLTLNVTVDSPATAGREVLPNAVIVTHDGLSGTDVEPGNDVAGDTDGLIAAPDLRILKSDGAADTVPDATLVYTLTVSNAGDQDAIGVVISDSIPAGTTFVSASANGADAALPSAGGVTWPPFDLPAGTAVTVTVTVHVDAGADAGRVEILNTATVDDDGLNGSDPTLGDNTVSDSDALTANPDLSVTKSDGETSTTPGATVTYLVSVTNSGNQAATGVTVVDSIPAGTTFESASDLGALDSGDVTWPTFSLAAGAMQSVSVTVTVDDPATAGRTTIVNSVTVVDDGLNGADPTPGDNSASDTDTLGAIPDLVVTKSDDDDSVEPGDTVAYEITVSNAGDQNATGVTLTDTLPGGITFVSATGTGIGAGTEDAGVITWPAFDLAKNTTETAIVTVTVDSPATAGRDEIVNGAAAYDDGLNGVEPTSSNNTAVDTDALDAAPDLRVVKTNGLSSASAGDVVTYTVTVGNVGNQDATGVDVTDTLPDGLEFVTASGGGVFFEGTITWPTFDLAVLAAVSYTVTVDVTDPAAAGIDSLTNTATATDDGGNGEDPTPADNTATDTDMLAAAPDLTISKTDGETEARPGDVRTYTLTVSNVGDQDATGVTVADFVVDGTTLVEAPATVEVGAGAELEDGRIMWPEFDLAVGETVELTVTYVVDAGIPAGLELLLNIATVHDDQTNGDDPTPEDNIATDADDLIANPDLVVTKTNSKTQVFPGETLTYAITVTNVGDQDSSGVITTDTLAAGTEFISATGSGTLLAGVVTWPAATIPAGATLTYSATVIVALPFTPSVLQIDNVAAAVDNGFGGSDPTPADNTAIDSDTVDNSLDLAITNSNGTDVSTAGTHTTYTLRITNRGPAPVARFTVIDLLPAQLANVTFQSSQGTYDPGTQVWSGPAVAVDVTVTIAVTGLIAVDAFGALTNETSVAPLDGLVDANTGDNSATDVDSLVLPPVLPETENFDPEPVDPLPTTGADVRNLLVPAGALIAGGFVLLVMVRRRESGSRGRGGRTLI